MKINNKEFEFSITNIDDARNFEQALQNMQKKEKQIQKLSPNKVVSILENQMDMFECFFIDAVGQNILEGCRDVRIARKSYEDFLNEINKQKDTYLEDFSPDRIN